MLAYLSSGDESKCCGCRSCEQACPVNAISMGTNEEGFLYPVLHEDLCVNCSLCEKVCPVMSRPAGQPPKAVYAIQHRDGALLSKSSSGGAFRLLADYVIDQGGCVAGCVWNNNFEPIFQLAYTHDELGPMQGSKYLSSDTGRVYIQIKDELDAGRQVLFTGTPCQCAGLLSFLQRPYENLLTADFLCHGVPSQQIFDWRLESIRKENRIPVSPTVPQGITSYAFRDKEKRGWGLVTSYTWQRKGGTKKRYAVGLTDPYEFGFLNGYFNRYICYSCPFRGKERFTDFTFCDFWGVERHHPEFDAQKGVSALALNTQKAEKMFTQVKERTIAVETNIENVAEDNPSILRRTSEHIPETRRFIYKKICVECWKSIAKKYLRCDKYYAKKLWYALPSQITKIIKYTFLPHDIT